MEPGELAHPPPADVGAGNHPQQQPPDDAAAENAAGDEAAGNDDNNNAAAAANTASPVSFSEAAPTFAFRETVSDMNIAGARLQLKLREKKCVRYAQTERQESFDMTFGVPGGPDIVLQRSTVSRAHGPHALLPVADDGLDVLAKGRMRWPLVVGIFSAPEGEPQEVAVWTGDGKHLWRQLRWAVWRLRGINGLVSLKTVAAFKVYQCLDGPGGHRRIDLDDSAVADMRQLFLTYRQLWWKEDVAIKWAQWVDKCLGKHSYSIELVLDWSPTRISVALLLPVALSLAIGLWFNSRDWTDLATIQTAWGIASYVVTATGLLAALLTLISGLGHV